MTILQYAKRKFKELKDFLYSLKDYLPTLSKSMVRNAGLTGAALTMLASSAFGCIKNEVRDYEIGKNLPAAVMEELKPLELQLDTNKKKLIDTVADYSGTEQSDLAKLAISGKVDDATAGFLGVLPIYSPSEKEEIISTVAQDSKVDENEYRGLVYLSNAPANTKYDIICNLGLNDDVFKWLSVLSDLKDQGFANYALSHRLTIEDKRLTDLEVKFLNNPDAYRQELFNYYLSQIGTINSDLETELGKLPDMKNMQIDDMRKLKGVENILALEENQKYRFVFWSMLNDRIEEEKIWTSGEALFSIACNTEFSKDYDPLNSSDDYLKELMYAVWTKGLDTYRPDIWENFDNATDRLNSPSLVSLWVFDNLQYDIGRLKNVGDPKTTFKLRKGVCRHYAMFATECLLKGGYEVKNLTVTWGNNMSGLNGHTVSVLNKDSKLWVVMDTTMNNIQGPYETYNEIANSLIARLAPTQEISNIFVEDNRQVMDRNASVFGLDP